MPIYQAIGDALVSKNELFEKAALGQLSAFIKAVGSNPATAALDFAHGRATGTNRLTEAVSFSGDNTIVEPFFVYLLPTFYCDQSEHRNNKDLGPIHQAQGIRAEDILDERNVDDGHHKGNCEGDRSQEPFVGEPSDLRHRMGR